MAKVLGHATKSINCVLNRKQMVKHAIPSLVVKTTEQSVMLVLDSCVTAIISFDLWMSKSGRDTFALVINFINS